MWHKLFQRLRRRSEKVKSLRTKYQSISANVVFLCHDGAGQFLMSLRGENTRDNHGLWDPGSGEIAVGETSAQALKRELGEEYGVSARDTQLLGVRENVNSDSHWITFEYLVLVDRDAVLNNEPHKLIQLSWFSLADLPLDQAHPLFSLLVKDYYSTLDALSPVSAR